MKSAFYERVLILKLEENSGSSNPLKNIDKSEIQKVKILDWGTNRDGTYFGGENPDKYRSGAIGYIRADSMGIRVEGNTFLVDRGYILGLD